MTACYCDNEGPSVSSITIVTARKPHRCEPCGRIISAGEKYERVWGVWDGIPETFKTCEDCLSLRKWVVAHVPCFCWTYQNLLQEAIDEMSEWERECPGVSAEAKQKIDAIIAKRNAVRATKGEADVHRLHAEGL